MAAPAAGSEGSGEGHAREAPLPRSTPCVTSSLEPAATPEASRGPRASPDGGDGGAGANLLSALRRHGGKATSALGATPLAAAAPAAAPALAPLPAGMGRGKGARLATSLLDPPAAGGAALKKRKTPASPASGGGGSLRLPDLALEADEVEGEASAVAPATRPEASAPGACPRGGSKPASATKKPATKRQVAATTGGAAGSSRGGGSGRGREAGGLQKAHSPGSMPASGADNR